MTERPILMSAPMVRAILDGSKSQTRRVVKPRPPEDVARILVDKFAPITFDRHGDAQPGADIFGAFDATGNWGTRCPYGAPGDRLWVRETFQIDAPRDGTWHDTQWYGCKGSLVAEIPERFQHPRFCNYRANWLHGDIRWRPGIHMPRWASRIMLEVTGVRVERLLDITDADAESEGCFKFGGEWRFSDDSMHGEPNARDCYLALWEHINGTGHSALNPWTWVISFKVLQ